jgi:hypothetical protein
MYYLKTTKENNDALWVVLYFKIPWILGWLLCYGLIIAFNGSKLTSGEWNLLNGSLVTIFLLLFVPIGLDLFFQEKEILYGLLYIEPFDDGENALKMKTNEKIITIQRKSLGYDVSKRIKIDTKQYLHRSRFSKTILQVED